MAPDSVPGDVLVFLPGFVVPAGAYAELLKPLVDRGIAVQVPTLYRPTPRVLLGRFTVAQEAQAAVAFVESEVPWSGRLFIGGHSRGGQAAWRTTQLLLGSGRLVSGLIAVDPVDGGSPRARRDFVTDTPTDFPFAPLVIGAGRGGKCAPEDRNHVRFAASAPKCRHVVIPDLGHGDVVSGRAGWAARKLCGTGVVDVSRARAEVSAIMVDYIEAAPGPSGT
ncbi:MAG: hypothetical protein WC054_14390 [Candidatus Nanopelagicales bacterium]